MLPQRISLQPCLGSQLRLLAAGPALKLFMSECFWLQNGSYYLTKRSVLSENLDWLVAKTRTFSGHTVAVGVAAVLQVPAKAIDWTDS